MPRAIILLAALFALSITSVHANSPGSQPFSPPQGWPKHLSIGSIHVNAAVEAVAFTQPKDVSAPFQWGDVAWYSRGPRPGDAGRAIVYGHLDSYCCPAVFWELHLLKPGDTIQVAYKSGRPLTFRVMWKAVYPDNGLPYKYMYANTNEHGLLLVTCEGVFRTVGGYDHKTVVYARLQLPNGQIL